MAKITSITNLTDRQCETEEGKDKRKIMTKKIWGKSKSYIFTGKGLLEMWILNSDQKNYVLGFPGGAVVENLPANGGDTGSSPGLGRSHMPRSNWARKSQLLSLCVWSLCSATREAAIVRGPRTAMKSGPRSPQLEKALAQKRRPNTTINK